MTQENKDLLLKDLCMRFPYFTKVQINNEIVVLDSICDDDGYHFNFIGDNREGVNIENIKPYLFPFSSMTEEQKKELSEIIDLEVEVAISHIKNGTPNLTTGITRLNWLLKNHFDIYDLIPVGLANDATGKNIY